MIQAHRIVSILLLCVFTSGCVGWNIPILDTFHMKPWTVLSEGDQFGRDQLANRLIAATKLVPMKGWSSNSVISTLGEPQEIEVIEQNVSEDWYFIYYKNYKMWPKAKEGIFMVRFYHGEVIDVVSVS